MKINDIKLGTDKISRYTEIKNYLDDLYKLDHEEVVVFGFDSKLTFLLAEKITHTSEKNKALFDFNHIKELLGKVNAIKYILVHNHPNGVCIPSFTDTQVTKRLIKLSNKNKIELLEHYVFVDGVLFPIIKFSNQK